MDLKDFVSQTLTQIIEGVGEAHSIANQHNAEVNPQIISNHNEMGKQGILWGINGAVQIVKFDVALTVTEGSGTKGGIGVFAGAINLGSSGQSQSSNMSVSRVQFCVPLAMPSK
jgi:hypothetical protein